MEAIQNKTTNKIVGIKNAGWVIICCFIIAICIYPKIRKQSQWQSQLQ